MLLTRELLERVGLFREDYFFSFEDLDLCSALARRVIARCAYRPHAHITRGTVRSDDDRRGGCDFATRNHLKVAGEAGATGGAAGVGRAAWIVGLNAAYAMTSADAPLVPGLAAVVRGAWDHLRGRYGPD